MIELSAKDDYGASSSQTSCASVSNQADAAGRRQTVVPAQSVPTAQRQVALGVLQPVSVAHEYMKSGWQYEPSRCLPAMH